MSISFSNSFFLSKLYKHCDKISRDHMRELFRKEANRFEKFSIRYSDDILFDFSKNRITQETMTLLFKFAGEIGIEKSLDRINQNGIIVNRNRLYREVSKIKNGHFQHTKTEFYENESNLHKLLSITESIYQRNRKGFTGKNITDIVFISTSSVCLCLDLVLNALKDYSENRPRIRFLSNIDHSSFEKIIFELDPEKTFFIILWNYLLDEETIINTLELKKWFLNTLKTTGALGQHFLVISGQNKALTIFGLQPNNVIIADDWLQDRYILWTTAGASIVSLIGIQGYKELLSGAIEIDNHFFKSPMKDNIPVVMAMLSIWYINFFGAETYAIFPYNERLSKLPNHIQQLQMVSCGKSVDKNGVRIDYQTAPIVWGGVGPSCQYTYMEILNQGARLVPSDLILIAKSPTGGNDRESIVAASFFAQSELLMIGQTKEKVETELKTLGFDQKQIKIMSPHMVLPGNQPSNSFLIKELNAEMLGWLIACYEHKVSVQSLIWNLSQINIMPFLGRKLK